MSSTNRNKEERLNSIDYYATPPGAIRDFFNVWFATPAMAALASLDQALPGQRAAAMGWTVLDPCAGGDPTGIPMSYPTVLKEYGFQDIDTVDIRQDSLAAVKGDYLKMECPRQYDLVITNPPFNLALQIIQKALAKDVKDGGYVVMLQRVNFLGSKSRKPFFMENMPLQVFVHSARMKFVNTGSTDSIEYAHFVWKKNAGNKFAELRIV